MCRQRQRSQGSLDSSIPNGRAGPTIVGCLSLGPSVASRSVTDSDWGSDAATCGAPARRGKPIYAKRTRAGLACGAVTVLTLSLLPTAAGAEPRNVPAQQSTACSEEPSPEAAALTDARDLNTPVVTAGTVNLSDGDTPAADATVELLAYPDSEKMAALEEGDTFDLTPVGRTTTDADGAYEMRVDPGVDLSQLARDERTMDVSLRVTTADGTAVEEASLSPDEATGGAEAEAALAGDDRQSSLPANADLELTPMSQRESFQTEEHAAAATQAAASGDYTAQYDENLGTQWTNIGSVFVKVTGVWAQVKHRSNADASLGVAVDSGNGYSASYTVDRYSSTEIQFPRYGRYEHHFFDTQRVYGKYNQYHCGMIIGSTVKPIAGTGNSGSRIRSADHLVPADQPRANCAKGEKGTKFIKTTQKAVTWTTGAKVDHLVGFNMSTRTGFSQQAAHEFEFMSAGRGYCGTKANPAYADPGALSVQYY